MPSNYEWAHTVLQGRAALAAVATAETDAAGRFSLDVPGAGIWTVVVGAAGHVPMRYSPLPVVGSTELPPVTLVRDAGTRIAIRDRAGKPAAGVWVYAQSASRPMWKEVAADGWRVGARLGRSDEVGRIELPRAPDEKLDLSAFPPRSLAASQTRAGGQATLVVRADAEPEWTLEIGGEQGRPLAGVLVAAGDLAWPTGQTGEDGRLRLSGSPAGPVRLHLFSADGRRKEVELGPRDAGEPGLVRFTFALPARPTGRIIAASDRRPLAGALVWSAHDPGAFALTDQHGTYELVAPPGDHFRVHLRAAGFLPQAFRVQRQDSELGRAPTVALAVATTLAGRVLDPGGRPLSGVMVGATTLAPAETSRGLYPDPLASRAVSDARGHFILRDLRPQGEHELTAVKSGVPFHAPWQRSFHLRWQRLSAAGPFGPSSPVATPGRRSWRPGPCG